MALMRLSSDLQIASINPPDQSKQATLSAFWYPICRDKILCQAPWDFARSSVILAMDTTTTFPGWNFAYQYPANCLRAVAVMTSYGMRVGPAVWNGWFWPNQFAGYTSFAIPKIPYQVIQNATGTGRTILTDIGNTLGQGLSVTATPAYLYFIAATTLTTLFDPTFTDCLAWELAKELSGPLRVSGEVVKRAETMAKKSLLEAMSSMMNQAQQDPERDAQAILVR
jgi:hypothetical protein